jgi:DNA polymerase-1
MRVNQKAHGLKHLSEVRLKRKMIEIEELFTDPSEDTGKKKTKKNAPVIIFSRLSASAALVYAGSDGCNTFGLFMYYAQLPAEENMFIQQYIPLEVDHKMIDSLRSLVRPGIPVNFRYFYYALLDAIYRAGRTESFIFDLLNRRIELNSPKQLSELLFDDLKMEPVNEQGEPAEKNKSGYYSTAEEVLDKLFEKYPDVLILKYVVLWRKLTNTIAKTYSKALVNSYVDSLQPNTRIQPSFSLTNVPTGRLSSNASKGAERVSLTITKGGTYQWNYLQGSWDAGQNLQGINSSQLRTLKAKKIKKLPDAAGIDLDSLYPDWCWQRFREALAEV